MNVDGSERESSSLFDSNGRCLPLSLKAAAHQGSRRYFSVAQPAIDYGEIYERFRNHLAFSGQLSLDEFEQRAEAILESLRNDVDCSNIVHGVAVPFILPKAEYDDIGQALEADYLSAVQKSFQSMFPEHAFVNHCSGGLAGKLTVSTGSRHEKLLQAMRQDVVVGYYFPCLLEYSVPAAIEKISALPSQFLLAGGFDTAAAFIGSPNLLLKSDGYPPLLWLSGLESEAEGAGYHFEAYGYGLTFNRRAHLGNVAEYWASGLVVLG